MFFCSRRMAKRKRTVSNCKTKDCEISPQTRNNCPECRYKKCIEMGRNLLVAIYKCFFNCNFKE